MFQKTFARFVLFGLLSLMIGATSVFAQDSSCSLMIEVKSDDNETVIKGAAATAVNNETKKVYRSVVRKSMPLFTQLGEGEYLITLTKAGYKKSAYSYIVRCLGVEDGLITTSVPMWRGNSKETVSVNEKDQINEPAKDSDSPVGISGSGATVSSNSSKTISGGVLNGKATNLVKPAYPAAARAVEAAGAVNVQVTIDEQGNVISAAAVSGHPLLRSSAVKAARESTFAPTRLSGQLVKVTGIIVYNFVP